MNVVRAGILRMGTRREGSRRSRSLIWRTAIVLSVISGCTSSSDSDDVSDAATDAGRDAGVHRDASAVEAGFDASTTPVDLCSATALPPDAGVCSGNCNGVTIYNFNPTGFATQSGEGYFVSQSGSVDVCDLPACATMSQLYYKSGASNYGVTVAGTSIYWTVNARDIWTSDETGAGAHSIVTTTTDITPRGLAVSGTTLYWGLVPNTIEACDVTNCAATQHDLIPSSAAAGTLSVAVTDKALFWSDYNDISMSDLDGGNVQTLVTGITPLAIAVDGCGIYWWASGAAVWTCKISDCSNTTRLLATVNTTPNFASLGADGTNVYFVDRDFQQMYVIPEPQ